MDLLLAGHFHKIVQSPLSITMAWSVATGRQVSLDYTFRRWRLCTQNSSLFQVVILAKFVDSKTWISSLVPLKSISVILSNKDFVAAVAATLNYENEKKVPWETIFVFPGDEDSVFYSFEALVDGKQIVAELQDKMKVWWLNTLFSLPFFLWNCILFIFINNS